MWSVDYLFLFLIWFMFILWFKKDCMMDLCDWCCSKCVFGKCLVVGYDSLDML